MPRLYPQAAVALTASSTQGTHGLIRTLTDSSIEAFQQMAEAKARGVYVFCLSGQRGSMKPWYVGIAEKQTLAQEAFTPDKLRKYARAMFGRSGNTHLFCLHPPKKGPKAELKSVETLLIWMARAKNPELLNERKVSSAPKQILLLVNKIEIVGVLNANPGQPSGAAAAFKEMMDL